MGLMTQVGRRRPPRAAPRISPIEESAARTVNNERAVRRPRQSLIARRHPRAAVGSIRARPGELHSWSALRGGEEEASRCSRMNKWPSCSSAPLRWPRNAARRGGNVKQPGGLRRTHDPEELPGGLGRRSARKALPLLAEVVWPPETGAQPRSAPPRQPWGRSKMGKDELRRAIRRRGGARPALGESSSRGRSGPFGAGRVVGCPDGARPRGAPSLAVALRRSRRTGSRIPPGGTAPA